MDGQWRQASAPRPGRGGRQLFWPEVLFLFRGALPRPRRGLSDSDKVTAAFWPDLSAALSLSCQRTKAAQPDPPLCAPAEALAPREIKSGT